MSHKVCFIGHRQFLPPWLAEQLKRTVEETIKNGCQYFTMGTHGDFDRLALAVCRQLKSQYPTLKIEVILTNPPPPTDSIMQPNQDIETIMYEIETLHPKQRIWFSNQKMVENCDTLICYADNNWHLTSGTHKVVKYALKRGLQIINLADYSRVNSST